MKELEANLWDTPADAWVITTNGTIKSNGRAVMGRGVAQEACYRYYMIQKVLGEALTQRGNHVQILNVRQVPDTLAVADPPLVAFPVKHNWMEPADLELIARSAVELVALTGVHGWRSVILPRPGCNNGRRDWEREVKPILLPLLDDRFTVVNKPVQEWLLKVGQQTTGKGRGDI